MKTPLNSYSLSSVRSVSAAVCVAGVGVLLAVSCLLFGCSEVIAQIDSEVTDPSSAADSGTEPFDTAQTGITLESLPVYSGSSSIELKNNNPDFTESDIERADQGSFIDLSDLDSLGRCGAAFACIGTDTMDFGERGDISSIHPTGWHHSEYDFVDQKSLYNRCHLLGHHLTGLNAEPRNLITGTRYLNTEGMLPFENSIGDYVEKTGNHVLYRVTPIFESDNLLASGVQMEGYSVEDDGEGICFNIYCYNVEPGVGIDYATGDNWEDPSTKPDTSN